MKVIEKGPGWSIKCKCTGAGNGNAGCESTLLVEEEDIYVTSHTDYAGDTDYYYTFRCPVCEAETDIPDNKLPARIRESALRLYKTGSRKIKVLRMSDYD